MSARSTMRRWLGRLRSSALAETGTATLEFLVLMPVMFFFLANSVETTTILARSGLLDRALDITMRDLRLGRLEGATFEQFRAEFCDNAIGVPDCMNAVSIELRPLNPVNVAEMSTAVECRDRSENIAPAVDPVQAGRANQVMLVRVCASYEPMFPAYFGVGAAMPKDPNGDYRLVSLSSYVREP